MNSKPFHIISSLNLPFFTLADLEKLGNAGRRFNIEKMRFTPGGQLAVSGIVDKDIPEFTALLSQFMQPIPENGISVILACPGCNDCKHGLRDTTDIAEKLQNLHISQPLPAKVKIAIAGCPRCCTMPRLRDIGLIPAAGASGGWHLYFGGNGGANPRISDRIAENLSTDQSLEYIKHCLDVYKKNAQPGMRTSRFIEAIGIAAFIKKTEKTYLP